MTFDSFGSSPLGERIESPLGAFSKGSGKGIQCHVGDDSLNHPGAISSITNDGVDIFVGVTYLRASVTYFGILTISEDMATIVRLIELGVGAVPPAYLTSIGPNLYFDSGAGSRCLVPKTSANVTNYIYSSTPVSGQMLFVGTVGLWFVLDAGTTTGQGILEFNISSGSVNSVNTYAHASTLVDMNLCNDGTTTYIIAADVANDNRFYVIKLASDYSVTAAKSYVFSPGNYSSFTGHPVVTDGIIVMQVKRVTGNPVNVGINTSDLTVAWSKTSKKQTSTATILINDAASTYRITISGQTVSVSGGADADATALSLQAACAASALSNFTPRTWTVASNVVTGTSNVAGVVFTLTTSVIAGTGTMSAVNTPNTSQFNSSANPIAEAGKVYWPGQQISPASDYAIQCKNASDGTYEYSSVTSTGGSQIMSGVTLFAGEPITCGGQIDSAIWFGFEDVQLIRWITPDNDLQILEDDIILTVTDEVITRTSWGSGNWPTVTPTTTTKSLVTTWQIAPTTYTF